MTDRQMTGVYAPNALTDEPGDPWRQPSPVAADSPSSAYGTDPFGGYGAHDPYGAHGGHDGGAYGAYDAYGAMTTATATAPAATAYDPGHPESAFDPLTDPQLAHGAASSPYGEDAAYVYGGYGYDAYGQTYGASLTTADPLTEGYAAPGETYQATAVAEPGASTGEWDAWEVWGLPDTGQAPPPDAWAATPTPVGMYEPAEAYETPEAHASHSPHGEATEPAASYDAYEGYDAYETYAAPAGYDGGHELYEAAGADADTEAATDSGAGMADGPDPAAEADHEAAEAAEAADDDARPVPPPRAARGRRRSSASNGRRAGSGSGSGGVLAGAARRARARRSAFLSVAAPSLAVLGVTAIATAATVSDSGTGSGDPAPVAAPDSPAEAEPVAANRQFDTQLAGLSQAATDYASRASLTQADIDLEAQREQEEAEAEAEAARLEALRPKFALPVEQAGLSAYFGEAGVNWMSLHTGIDFPVSYGTPVMAATDGSITTQWDPSYGTMIVLTAPDGTETWYTHLSSTLYTSGWVQAGAVIAYSGDSGNSTGPHLHFEVRPYGGSPVDPLTWLRDHGLEPL
ncbi:M23 family metallopeptidase [Streptomyces sp. 4N509B]|uniref:M23 family metallopeptidase n=1 Tax=Streptomyces sp. 4N509B TaxID=3457413 RepID=UPI003FD060DB